MADFLASDVLIKEEPPVVRPIRGVATAVLGMVGITERGPMDREVVCVSPDDFDRTFGGPTANNQDTYLGMSTFFTEGGEELHFVRTCHHTTATDPTTKTSAAATATLLTATAAATGGTVTSSNTTPWDLEPGDTLIVATDAASGTATFNATAAARQSTNTETYAITNGWTITVKIDRGSVQTVAFLTSEFVDIANATAEEIAAVINTKIVGAKATATTSGTKVTITSDRRGTGSYVEVTGGTANGAIAFATAEIAGTGNVSNIDAVTFAEAKSLVEAANAGVTCTNSAGALTITRNTTGTGATVQVTAPSTADDEFGFDNAVHAGGAGGTIDTLQVDAKDDGTYGNGLSIIIAAATSGDADEFNLKVVRGGVPVETWANLSMTDTDARYVETVINDPDLGSLLISVTDLDADLPSPQDLPAAGTFGPLTGGLDGLSSLGDTDFNGGTGSNGKVGLRCLDAVQTLTLLAVPQRATASVAAAMITYCEVTREGQVFSVPETPAGLSETGIVDYIKTNGLQRLSEYAAMYWPRIKVDNPSKGIFGNTNLLVSPISGAVCGIYARGDGAQPSGVFQAPAGTENGRVFSARGLENDRVKEKPVRQIIFPELINPISIEDGTPIFLDGARTLKDDGSWPTIGERRGVIFVETSLRKGLTFMRHKNITDRLYSEGDRAARAFLIQQTKNGAFSTTDPDKAFTVDFGKGLNRPSTKFARQVVSRVGLATAKPAEFIIVKVSPDLRDLQAELAAA